MSDTKRGPGTEVVDVVVLVVVGELGRVVVDDGGGPAVVVELAGAVVEDVAAGPFA